MLIQDEIYGEFEVTEPVLVELINSKPFQRLKHVTSDGANRFIFEIGDPTRYKHSLGVYYIASRFTGKDKPHGVETLIMALLHDIAHTAFSHVADYVLGDGVKQDFHNQVVAKFIVESEIAEILEKYDYKAEDFLDEDQFPMIGTLSGVVNADRFDYFMRDAVGLGIATQAEIKSYVEALRWDEEKELFYFEERNIAGSFMLTCLNTSRLSYTSALSVGSYYLLSETLKIAMAEGIIAEEDLFTTDAEVLEKLHAAKGKNPEMAGLLGKLNRNTSFEICTEKEADITSKTKFRYVDPLVKVGANYKKVSDIIPNIRELILQGQKHCEEIFIRYV